MKVIGKRSPHEMDLSQYEAAFYTGGDFSNFKLMVRERILLSESVGVTFFIPFPGNSNHNLIGYQTQGVHLTLMKNISCHG